MSTKVARLPVEIGGDGRFIVDPEPPGYLRLHEAGELRIRAGQARDLLAPCRVCPRPCRGVDRLADEVGACRIGRYAHVASAFPHLGEEEVLRGWRGSGTVFFSGCNLRCVFCQNADISQRAAGTELSPGQLASMLLAMQAEGCHNINLVTPEHVVPQVLEALPLAAEAGLTLPLVYNTSAYDALDSLALLDGVVDVYMPDIKLFDPRLTRRYLGVPDYGEVARQAVAAMHAQVGDLVVDRHGIARRGLVVRHLVMPGLGAESEAIVRWIAALSRDTYLNVMDQYRTDWKVLTTDRYPQLRDRVSRAEVDTVFAAARDAGLWRFDRRRRSLW
jgi:putative pyruvate formate lyase activating enzyme